MISNSTGYHTSHKLPRLSSMRQGGGNRETKSSRMGHETGRWESRNEVISEGAGHTHTHTHMGFKKLRVMQCYTGTDELPASSLHMRFFIDIYISLSGGGRRRRHRPPRLPPLRQAGRQACLSEWRDRRKQTPAIYTISIK